jgi:dolichol kinase
MKLSREIKRKIFHIISILSLVLVVKIFGKFFLAGLMVAMASVVYVIVKFNIKSIFTKPLWFFIENLEREENLKTLPAKEAFSLAIGITIVSLLFEEKIVLISIISLAVYDGIATIVGIKWGRIKLLNNRTLEGTVAGIIANTLALSFIISPLIGLIISIFVAIVENISSSKEDNFYIPVSTAFFSWFLFLYLRNFILNI